MQPEHVQEKNQSSIKHTYNFETNGFQTGVCQKGPDGIMSCSEYLDEGGLHSSRSSFGVIDI